MKRLLNLSFIISLMAAIGAPLDAAPKDKGEKERGRGAAVRQQVAPQRAAPQRSARVTQAAPQRMTQANTSGLRARSSSSVAVREPARPQRSVTSIPQNRITARQSTSSSDLRAAARSSRAVTTDRNFTASTRDRDWDRDRDRDRDWDRDRRDRDRDHDRNRDWRRDSWRFSVPIATYRNWDRNRIYTWNDHRYHWYGGSWVIVDPGYDYEVYDRPAYVTTSLVYKVQTELAREGYDPGLIDGVFGGQTRRAIIAFQEDNGLPVTGRIDRPLLLHLSLM